MTAKKQPVKKIASKKSSPAANSIKSQEAKWQAEDDVRTLMRADEIKADKSRMIMAKQIAKKQAADAAKIAAKLGK